jgi:hypothetical protein
MRRSLILGTGAAILAFATPAVAAVPEGQGLGEIEGICDGQPAVATITRGESFYVNGVHYVGKTFTGTFTPTEGEPETFTTTRGRKTGRTETITCSGRVESPEGVFEFEVVGVAVP